MISIEASYKKKKENGKRYIIQRLFERIRGENFAILFMEKNEMKFNSIRFNCYIFPITDDYFV